MTKKLLILLVDDEALVRDELGGLLEDEGYEVCCGSDGEEALELFRRRRPDMVITDVRMPRRDGLSVAMVIRREAPLVPVTVITGHGSESMAIEALRAGATDFLGKPVRLEDLDAALGRMRAALEVAHQVRKPLPSSIHLVEHLWTYQLENDIAAVGPFVDSLLQQIASNLPLQILADLNIAIRELILNGIEHGNLGISYEAKTAALEEGTLHTALSARASQMPYLGRRVTVTARQSEEEIKVRIADQGEGFDWNALPDPTATANLLSDHGRGILLASTAVDSLTYNEQGNEVTIIKRVGGES